MLKQLPFAFGLVLVGKVYASNENSFLVDVVDELDFLVICPNASVIDVCVITVREDGGDDLESVIFAVIEQVSEFVLLEKVFFSEEVQVSEHLMFCHMVAM